MVLWWVFKEIIQENSSPYVMRFSQAELPQAAMLYCNTVNGRTLGSGSRLATVWNEALVPCRLLNLNF